MAYCGNITAVISSTI